MPLLVACGLFFTFIGTTAAQNDEDISFGIRPTRANEDIPETFSYFYHQLAPGTTINEEALVINDGGVPVSLVLYAADGFTAVNGGTAFTKENELSNGTSRGTSQWLSCAVREIQLAPGEELVVPFTINVPQNAKPGHHVAGLVVEAAPGEASLPSGEGDAQFAVQVIRRVGVAVVIDIPGEHGASLEIMDADLQQQDSSGAIFKISVHNTGNIYIKGSGTLLVSDTQGTLLATVPLAMDTVLPGDITSFEAAHPIFLIDNDYLLLASINYEGKTALLEGAEIYVRGGESYHEKNDTSAASPFEVINIGTAMENNNSFPGGIIGILLVSLVVLLLLVSAVIKRKVILEKVKGWVSKVRKT